MALHQASGRWRLGLAMALLTAFSWATLPVALQITLASLLMALGGIFVFKENYKPLQWAGLGVIVLGLLLFFREQLAHAVSGRDYAMRSSLVLVAAVVWALYALLQKQLLVRLDSPSIQLFIYALAA